MSGFPVIGSVLPTLERTGLTGTTIITTTGGTTTAGTGTGRIMAITMIGTMIVTTTTGVIETAVIAIPTIDASRPPTNPSQQ